ncbi:hypothetical protein PM8797T_11109 [Gimesia maris DSM 8797]|nr:hypothetical protein PM8797T_11109 [Gimesia maris DSM 8797]
MWVIAGKRESCLKTQPVSGQSEESEQSGIEFLKPV